jgi:hypothetical protein
LKDWLKAVGESELLLFVDEAEDPAKTSFRLERKAQAAAPRRKRAGGLTLAVRPDWTDGRGLMGFYNPITETYQASPFLDLLIAADAEQTRARQQGRPPEPFFVVLDEMNLARVEHYFSDFLSCMESGQPIALHNNPQVEESQDIPRALVIPRNLFFTGTVNVDETTYMFSPKVLDRAFTLEFNQVDLTAYGEEATDEPASNGAERPFELYQFAGSLEIGDGPRRDDWLQIAKLDRGLNQTLVDLNAILAPEHRHFGYRVANEIARFVSLAARQAGGDASTLWAALDIAVLAKVMSKLHGTQQELEALLGRLFSYAVAGDASRAAEDVAWKMDGARLVPPPGHTAPRLPRTAAKLWRMLRRLRQQGFTSFIE